jgi:hypothetical protein
MAQRGLPAQRLPQVVRQTAARVAQSPQLVRRMAQIAGQVRSAAGSTMRRRTRPGTPGGYAPGGVAPRYGRAPAGAPYYRGGGGVCPHCARRRTYLIQGPVRLTISPA